MQDDRYIPLKDRTKNINNIDNLVHETSPKTEDTHLIEKLYQKCFENFYCQLINNTDKTIQLSHTNINISEVEPEILLIFSQRPKSIILIMFPEIKIFSNFKSL